MWSHFYQAGGWGMYPVTVFGFALVAAAVLYVLRPEQRRARLVQLLGVLTFGSGLLGTCVGICTSAHYIPGVPKAEQLEILALGVQESLHNVVLGLLVIMVAGLIACAGVLRAQSLTPVAK